MTEAVGDNQPVAERRVEDKIAEETEWYNRQYTAVMITGGKAITVAAMTTLSIPVIAAVAVAVMVAAMVAAMPVVMSVTVHSSSDNDRRNDSIAGGDGMAEVISVMVYSSDDGGKCCRCWQ